MSIARLEQNCINQVLSFLSPNDQKEFVGILKKTDPAAFAFVVSHPLNWKLTLALNQAAQRQIRMAAYFSK
jgi:hypothetical protein